MDQTNEAIGEIEKPRHPGWDMFCLSPGLFDKKQCVVCDTEMEVHRDQHGPTSFAAAMSHKGRDYDLFFCPHSREDWHSQALAICQVARTTPSSRLEAMLIEEATEILKTREATKTSFRVM